MSAETPAASTERRFDTTVKPRRRPLFVAAGIAIVVVGALLITQLIHASQTENRVLEVHADVARGEVIRDTDLVAVTVGQVDNVSTVPADQLDSLVGKRATADLRAGSLLPAGAIGPADVVPAPGKSLVGLKLAAGQIPIGDLAAGTKLRLIQTSAGGSSTTGQGATNTDIQSWAATMASGTKSTEQVTLINVEVDSRDAARIAQLTSQGRIAVVKDSTR
ncbi:SAF domain-containing protein [Cutibacterium acnes]|nr:SAF domain-containing protein [Cutibacterium acnes]MCY0870787.1 SAF domain-containing protein [Bacillota bacterium]PGF24170.1 flagellar biosynthesis protein FlgA [Cutibacterium acnes subsp. defendens]TLG53186.1 flagellar biosynthesis protein FlgA [Cutibacterium acnes]TMT70233.1 flagellar biosynthesis protein FlgA [Cutibacterium acnes]